MKKNLLRIIAFSAIAVSFCAIPAVSHGATPEEAMAIARQYGIPEDTLQQCLNEYYAHPDQYPPEVIDGLIASLRANFDNVITNVPYNPDAVVDSVTTTTTVVEENPANEQPTATEPIEQLPADDSITLTMPDGSTFSRISADKFIALSYDDKMTYLSTFTEEQQTIFINNLSPEEYKSMLKQIPDTEKISFVDSLTDIADTFNMNITVDEISGDNVSYSMKNQDGELVAVGSIKEAVDNTGYDRRGIFAFAGAMLFAGFSGLLILAKKCFRKDSYNE